jgi:hypothetical protein
MLKISLLFVLCFLLFACKGYEVAYDWPKRGQLKIDKATKKDIPHELEIYVHSSLKDDHMKINAPKSSETDPITYLDEKLQGCEDYICRGVTVAYIKSIYFEINEKKIVLKPNCMYRNLFIRKDEKGKYLFEFNNELIIL